MQFSLTNALEGETSEVVRRNIEEENRIRILERQLQMFQDLNAEAQGQFSDFFQNDRTVMDGLKGVQDEFTQFFKDNQPDLWGDVLEDSAAAAANALEDTIGATITSLVQGANDLSDKLRDIASNLLGTLGSAFLRAGLGGLGLPGFADGGRPEPGALNIVGERGPELFVPDSPGTVLSNQDSRAALSTYSRMSPEQQAAADKGADDAAAADAYGRESIQIQMETTNIAGEEYLTRAQGEQLAAAAAKQGAQIGEAQMLRRLRMNPATRKQVGI